MPKSDMFIVIARRVMPLDNKDSHWTWTLYTKDVEPIARAEYSWQSPVSARNAAYKFLRAINLKLRVRLDAAARESRRNKDKP